MDESDQERKRRQLTAGQFYANFNISDQNDRVFSTADNTAASTTTSGSSANLGNLKKILFTKKIKFSGATESEHPIEFFNFFFTPEFIATICECTNENARIKLQDPNLRQKSPLRKWTDLTGDELRIFLGLLFHMGTINMSEFREYWSRDRLFQLPTFVEQMSRERFLIIIRFLKFVHIPVEDSYSEISCLVEYFNEIMTTFYQPERKLLFTDDVLINNGRVAFNHHNKVNKGGLKFYTLSEPDGLVVKLHVHPGGETTNPELGNSVIKEIMKDHLNKGHALYTNVCYQGYVTAKYFLDNQTYYTGLMEELPEKYKENALKTLQVGESTAIFRDNVHIGTWRGAEPISYITSEYDNYTTFVSNKRDEPELAPLVVVRFKEIMKTKERKNELIEFYPCRRKPIKTYLKAAIHIFQVMLMNSYKIYNKCSMQPKISFRGYRLTVINKILPMKSTQKLFNWKGHMIKKFERKNAVGQTYRKLCRMCRKAKRKRKDSVWYCAGCQGKPGLCVECFYEYHVQLNNEELVYY